MASVAITHTLTRRPQGAITVGAAPYSVRDPDGTNLVWGGDAALGVYVPRGLVAGSAVVITTDGTNPLGATGPSQSSMLFIDGDGFAEDASQAADDPVIGSWQEAATNRHWIDAGKPSGTMSPAFLEADASDTAVFGVTDAGGAHGLEEFTRVFFSYALKDLGAFPGVSSGNTDEFAEVSSAKDAWMMLGNRGDNSSIGTNEGHDLTIPSWTSSNFQVTGNETSMSPQFTLQSLEDNWEFQGWNCVHFAGALDPLDLFGDADICEFRYANGNNSFLQTRTGNLMTDQGPAGTDEGVTTDAWDRIKFGAFYVGATPDATRVTDFIYIATGPGCMARVMLCDSDVEANITKFWCIPPTAWATGEVKARFAEGLYDSASDELWAWVYDSDNSLVGKVQLV